MSGIAVARHARRARGARVGWTTGRRSATVLAVLIVGLLVRLDSAVIDEGAQFSDAMQNVRFGHALASAGEFTHPRGDATMYREPLPIAAIAIQMRLDPRLSGVTLAELSVDGPAIRAVKQQNLVWAAILLGGVALQSFRLARSARLTVALVSVLAVHAVFVEAVGNRNLSELPAAAFIVWAGLLAHDTLVRQKVRSAVLSGLALGLAALTKASMLYIGAAYLVVLATVLLVRRRGRSRTAIAGIMAASILMAALVTPWMVRNAQEFGTASLSDRGGLSIWYRAIYKKATPEELRGAWFAFTPEPLGPVVGTVLGVSAEDLEGPLRRVHRFHPDETEEQRSLYSLARIDRLELTERYLRDTDLTREQARVLADAELRARSLEVLRRDPRLFLSTTPMFLWRGTWPILSAPLVPRALLGVVNPLAMVALLIVGFHAVLARRPERFAVVGLPLGVVAFSALLTMYEPRFTEPALPVMLLLLVLGGERMVLRLAHLRR